MKGKELEIDNIKPGEIFRHYDTYFNPPRVYFMRRMKRGLSSKYMHIIKRKCVLIQNYGFIQGHVNHFSKKKPAHWCIDGRYKAIIGWELEAQKKKKTSKK